jgi:hypothetical protein
MAVAVKAWMLSEIMNKLYVYHMIMNKTLTTGGRTLEAWKPQH